MKKILKITIIAILISFFIAPFIIPNEVEAVTMDEVFKSAKDFLTAGDSASKDYTEINTDRLKTGSQEIFNILFVAGTIVAIIIGLILGIQFMTAETESKAKIKESLMAYFIGCVVIFGAFTIWRIVVTIGNQI